MQLQKDLCQSIKGATSLYCDNESAIQLAENAAFHEQTKHVKVQYHFRRENVLNGEIRIEQINTNEQMANIFTKRVSNIKF